MNQHPYAEILRAVADGKEIIARTGDEGRWLPHASQDVLRFISSQDLKMPPFEFRIKPKTIRIGDVEVPEPMRVAPEIGQDYWINALTFVSLHTWRNDSSDKKWLSLGVCHATEEACQQHIDAILKLLRPA